MCCDKQITVTQIPTPNINVGISVHWDECTESVYFVDLAATYQNHSIYCYDYNKGRLYSAYIVGESQPINIFPFKECGKYKDMFAIGLTNETKIIQWDKMSTVARVVSTLFTLELDPSSSMSIGRGDPKGHLYQGTFSSQFCAAPANSSLYMYTKEKGVQRLFGNTVTTTGLAFNLPAGKAYHLDSCQYQIVEFDEDKKTGDICKRKPIKFI